LALRNGYYLSWLKVELDWLKNPVYPYEYTCRLWVSDNEPLPMAKQCVLAFVNRSTVYFAIEESKKKAPYTATYKVLF